MTPRAFVAGALAVSSVATAGDSQVATRVDVYEDGWMLIVVPSVLGVVETDNTTVRGTYALDVLSGATQAIPADTLTSATWYKERRHQAGLSLEAHPQETWGVGVGGTVSLEPDYHTRAVNFSGRTDLFDRMSTLTASRVDSVVPIRRSG